MSELNNADEAMRRWETYVKCPHCGGCNDTEGWIHGAAERCDLCGKLFDAKDAEIAALTRDLEVSRMAHESACDIAACIPLITAEREEYKLRADELARYTTTCETSLRRAEVRFADLEAQLSAKDAEIAAKEAEIQKYLKSLRDGDAEIEALKTDRDEWKRRAEAAEKRETRCLDVIAASVRNVVRAASDNADLEAQLKEDRSK